MAKSRSGGLCVEMCNEMCETFRERFADLFNPKKEQRILVRDLSVLVGNDDLKGEKGVVKLKDIRIQLSEKDADSWREFVRYVRDKINNFIILDSNPDERVLIRLLEEIIRKLELYLTKYVEPSRREILFSLSPSLASSRAHLWLEFLEKTNNVLVISFKSFIGELRNAFRGGRKNGANLVKLLLILTRLRIILELLSRRRLVINDVDRLGWGKNGNGGSGSNGSGNNNGDGWIEFIREKTSQIKKWFKNTKLELLWECIKDILKDILGDIVSDRVQKGIENLLLGLIPGGRIITVFRLAYRVGSSFSSSEKCRKLISIIVLPKK